MKKFFSWALVAVIIICGASQLLSGKRFALPSEAQWEYAACGGQQSMGYTYSGSNTIDEVAWYGDNSDGTTHPVGLKQPNELGIYDMTGNVWEYCNDWYADLDDIPADHGREKEHNGRDATLGFRIVLR